MNGLRAAITVLGVSVLALPFTALSQPKPGALTTIGVLSPFSRTEAAPWHEAFRNGLRGLGWIEGKLIPKLNSVAVLWNPQGTASVTYKETLGGASKLDLRMVSLEVRGAGDIENAVAEAARARAGALIVMPDPILATNLPRIAGLAIKSRLPSIFGRAEYADSGGLVADEVRAGHQSEDCQGARSRDPEIGPRTRRPGDRVAVNSLPRNRPY